MENTVKNQIRVRIPATVAYDLGSMNKVTQQVLNELGCPKCHSGFDIRFDLEQFFAFNANLERVIPSKIDTFLR